MNNLDLDISNYSIDDLKHFLNIEAINFDYADLQTKVKKKIAQIMQIQIYPKEQKKRLVKFINQINLKLVEVIKKESKQEEFHQNPNIDLLHPSNKFEYPPYKKESSNQHETKKTITHLSIDTKFRKNYLFSKSTDFYIDLPVALKNILSMRLESFEINNTIYNISVKKKTNKIYVKKTTNTSVVTETTIEVPDGNYNETDLIQYLNTSQNALNSIGVKIEFDSTTHKTKVTAIDGNGNNEITSQLDISFDYEMKCGEKNIEKSQEQFQESKKRNINLRVKNTNDPGCNPCPPNSKKPLTGKKLDKRISTTSLGWLLGFRKENYSGEFQFTSDCQYDLNVTKYLFLCINDFQKSMHELVKIVYQDSFLEKNILSRIPMTEEVNNKLFIFHETDTVKRRNYFGPVNIKRMHIQLIDEYGESIDLNGSDFSFNLEFEVLYERNIY